MENIKLTSKEKIELKKRGFFVKENIGFGRLLLDVLFTTILFSSLSGTLMVIFMSFGFLDSGEGILKTIISICIIVGVPLFFIFQYIFYYIFSGKLFFFGTKILAYGEVFDGKKQIKEKLFMKKLKDYLASLKSREVNKLIITSLLICSGMLGLAFVSALGITVFEESLGVLPLGIIGGVFTFTYISRQLVEHFHPLYAFGNLGEKIQKLTPEIESQSREIQSEFEKDMNFSILHSGFEKLSSTFSEIVSLVLKLEQVEARANKGNLFDSEKYINSLRSDIVAPLTSLQQFLENQKVELMKSQKELTRVRVGGSEESGNIELTSKRSESLIAELDMNIGALSEMIGKMENNN